MIVKLRADLDERASLYEAEKRRIKPIFMTSMTTILAVVPILFIVGLGAELQAPLALAVIGGDYSNYLFKYIAAAADLFARSAA